MSSITKEEAAVGDLRAVGSAEASEPGTTGRAAASAAAAPAAAGRPAAAAAGAAAGASEVVVMEASTTVMDMEETITPRGWTGGATDLLAADTPPNKLIWKPHVT